MVATATATACALALALPSAAQAVAVSTTIDFAVDGRDAAATTGTWDTANERWSLASRFPVVPTFATPVAVSHVAPGASDYCGYQGVATGDVDGNGRADVAMGCHGDDVGAATDAGTVIVATRNAANTGFDAAVVLSHPSPGTTDWCGSSITMGDVNGDGRSDVLMGCPLDDVGAVGNAGSVVVFLRNIANSGFDAGIVLTHPTPVAGDECSRYEGIAAGDVNGDGRSDVNLGCWHDDVGATTDSGSVVTFTRNAGNTGFDAAAFVAHPTPVASDQCGVGVETGDVNGDGRHDVLSGCLGREVGAVTDAGAGFVFQRNAGNTGFDAGVTLAPATPATSEGCGFNSALGDVNGDGRTDVVMACEADDGVVLDGGAINVHLRTVANTGFVAPVELGHPMAVASDMCGNALGVADVDGRGGAEIVASCTYRDNLASNSGSVLVWSRNAANTGFLPPVEREPGSPEADDACGTALASGDVDGDGLVDVVVGCGYEELGLGNAGIAEVHRSTAARLWTGVEPIGSGTILRHPSPNASDQCGISVELADVDYDGRDDLVQGCIGDDDVAVDAGSASIAMRTTSNSGFGAPTAMPGPAPSANASCGNVAVGDLNIDGKSDVLLGCQWDDTDAFDAGSFVVMRRNPANTGFVQARLTHPAPAASDMCGGRIGMGDVDGDGRDDALLGCPLDDVGATANAGSVVLYMRGPGSFGAGTIMSHPALASDDECGYGVSSGDVNGDGRMDIVIGCAKDDVTQTDQGSAVVFTRNLANNGFNTGVVLTHPSPAAGDSCGFDTAVGDVNADGRADVVLGCQSDDVGAATSAGSAVVFLRAADNSGFATGVLLTPPTPVASDTCGDSMVVGDATGDGRADVVVGCRYLDAAASNGGGAYVYSRNAANTAFLAPTTVTSPSSGTNAGCGISLSVGDTNGDGQPDLAMGCYFADGGGADSGETVVHETRRALVQTLDVATSARPITAATVTATTVANGGLAPTFEASADGGVNWEPVSSGVAHTFTTTGTALRVRARLSDTRSVGYATSPWVTGDIAVSYDVHEPRVTGVSPSPIQQGRRGVVVSVTGTEFDVGAVVGISGTGVTITNTTRVSSTRIDVTLDVAGNATVSNRDVTVTNPDTGTHTGSALLAISSPSISLSVSTLGYGDASRDAGPLAWGAILPGDAREIGPAGSGQALAGPGLRASVTSDTTWQLSVAATSFADGAKSLPVGAMSWKRFGVSEAWTSLATSSTVLANLQAPGSQVREYDLRIAIPAAQAAGTYSGTVTYTVVPQP